MNDNSKKVAVIECTCKKCGAKKRMIAKHFGQSRLLSMHNLTCDIPMVHVCDKKERKFGILEISDIELEDIFNLENIDDGDIIENLYFKSEEKSDEI